jgi:hypothetical protein
MKNSRIVKGILNFIEETVHVMTCDGRNCSWLDELDEDWVEDWNRRNAAVDEKDNQTRYSKKEYIDGEWVTVIGR